MTRAVGAVRLLAAAAATGAGLTAAGAQPAPPRADAERVDVVVRPAERRADVLVGGRPFTAYVYPAELTKPVLFPLRTASGVVVTRGFPLDPRPGERVDHPHHVGLWFTYGDVNGLDFWNNSSAIPAEQAARMGTIRHRAVVRAAGGKESGVLEVAADWVDHAGRPLLRERTRFVFRAGPGLRAVDRVTTLTALGDTVRFPDNKEGVIGLRVARGLEQPSTTPEVFTDASGRATTVPAVDTAGVTGRYRSSEGREGDAVWGTRGRWVTLAGTLAGEPVAVAVLDHPRNVGFPTYWHARGYGLFAANPLGQAALSGGRDTLAFRLAPGASTTFRHRVLILSGADAEPGRAGARAEAEYRDFARAPR